MGQPPLNNPGARYWDDLVEEFGFVSPSTASSSRDRPGQVRSARRLSTSTTRSAITSNWSPSGSSATTSRLASPTGPNSTTSGRAHPGTDGAGATPNGNGRRSPDQISLRCGRPSGRASQDAGSTRRRPGHRARWPDTPCPFRRSAGSQPLAACRQDWAAPVHRSPHRHGADG